jgi:hypothetical protein
VNDATTTLTITSGLLAIKVWLCGTITTYVRGRVMLSPNGEDGPVMNFFNRIFWVSSKPLTTIHHNGETDPLVSRWLRICGNDMANISIALLIVSLVVATSSMSESLLAGLLWTFLATRVRHMLLYAAAIQPWRTVVYSVGSIPWLAAAGSLIAG